MEEDLICPVCGKLGELTGEQTEYLQHGRIKYYLKCLDESCPANLGISHTDRDYLRSLWSKKYSNVNISIVREIAKANSKDTVCLISLKDDKFEVLSYCNSKNLRESTRNVKNIISGLSSFIDFLSEDTSDSFVIKGRVDNQVFLSEMKCLNTEESNDSKS